jgi:hypothetical protein
MSIYGLKYASKIEYNTSTATGNGKVNNAYEPIL